LKTLFTFFTKQATLMRRSTVLSLPLQLSVPWFNLFGVDDKERDAQDDGPELVDGVAEFSGRR
jgi:hypothetical protein